MVLVTRPNLFERRPGWGEGEMAFRRIDLGPLSRRASRALVDDILRQVDNLPDSLRDLIVDTAEGNPFYVEEMIKLLIDQGVIVRDPASNSADSKPWTIRPDRLTELKVPSTLTGLLQARLDGLTQQERAVLQRAAVVGRQFWDGTVADLAQSPLDELRPALAAVRKRELIFRREHSTFAETDEYIFKHSLLRDVAYETVLLKYRAEFHSRVARWLEAHAGERLNEYLGLIAEHYIQANEGLKAAEMLEQAGYEAVNIGAYSAAQHALEQALALREAAGETNSPAITRAAIVLGQALWRLGDYPAAEAALARGLAGAYKVSDVGAAAQALGLSAVLFAEVGSYDQAHASITDALRLTHDNGASPSPDALFHCAAAIYVMGNTERAEAVGVEALAAARQSGNLTVELHALSLLGAVATTQEDWSLAGEFLETSLEMARAMGNLSREAVAYGNLGVLARLREDYLASRSFTQISLTKFQELGEPFPIANGLLNLAVTDGKLGDLAAGRLGVQEAIKMAEALGTQRMVVWGVFFLGVILADQGQIEQAIHLYGLVRAHPAADGRLLEELDEELAQLDLSLEVIEAGLAAGAALDFDTVVQEILDGRW